MTLHKGNKILQDLQDIESKIESLNIPFGTFAGIMLEEDSFSIAELGGEKIFIHKNLIDAKNTISLLFPWIKKHALEQNIKFVAAALCGRGNLEKIGSKLWLSQDIVPLLKKDKKPCEKEAEALVREAASAFDENNIGRLELAELSEVIPSFLVTLEDYKKTASQTEYEKLLSLVKQFHGKKLIFISATAQGGGVALMRHALMRLYRLLEVDAHWYVLKDRIEAFEITKKKFHNVLQAVSSPDVVLNNKDKEIYNAWTTENADYFRAVIKNADVIVIDDPQPSGLMPIIRRYRPQAKIIYRSHIQIESDLVDQPGTPQSITWNFIWNNIKSCDCFIAHPIRKFIPKNVPKEKVVMMPATTDPLDGLNKELSKTQKSYYMNLFNRLLLKLNQSPLDLSRPYIIQVARFDPSKGIPDVVESFKKLRERMQKEGKPLPQLIIVGNGAVDDPDGLPILNITHDLIHSEPYKDLVDDIKIAQLPHIDQMLNVLLRESKIVLQLSHKEGFEIKVTEALMKAKPVIAYKAGGITLQIKDKQNGFLIEVGDTDKVAERMFDLLTNQKLYMKMSKSAINQHRRDVLTIPNAIRWLTLATELVKNGKVEGNFREI